MSTLKFGEMAPDQPSNNDGVLKNATNTIWSSGRYISMPGHKDADAIPVAGLGVGDTIQLVRSLFGNDEGAEVFLWVETSSIAKIYRYRRRIVSLLKTDLIVGRHYDIIEFGNSVVLLSEKNPAFSIPINANEQTVLTEITTVPTGCSIGAVARDRLFLAGDTENPHRAYFSGASTLSFSPVSSSGQGGYQDIPGQGVITAITGGEVAHIFTETGVDRMTEVGGDLVFQRDNISQHVGCTYRSKAYQVGQVIYFISHSGFKSLSPQEGIRNVGYGRVDQYITDKFANLLGDELEVTHYDDYSILFFPISPDNLLAYNYAEDKFTLIKEAGIDIRRWTRFEQQAIPISAVSTAQSATELEGVRIDDPRYIGSSEGQVDMRIVGRGETDGSIMVGYIGYGAEYNPSVATAIFETNELYAQTWLQAEQDERSAEVRKSIPPSNLMFLNELRLVGDMTTDSSEYDNAVDCCIAARDHEYQKPYQYGTPVLVPKTGDTLLPFMASGRYISFKVTARGSWQYLTGVSIAIGDNGQVASSG